MEPLQKQLKELPAKLGALPPGMRWMLVAVVALIALGVGAYSLVGAADSYQYAFTNLSAEDSAEAAGVLKTAQIPFRLEAGGAALAVPSSKVYDARLILATAGLPRGGGQGFELFDRGDLGVSEFTQRVNLRRATEGELARTLGRLGGVRSARVHVTMLEKGLFRDEDRKATAAVVLNLQPGHSLGERELAGIRHLVASAVPGLSTESVAIVDGKGTVLTSGDAWGDGPAGFGQKLEHDLEQRVVSLLEPVVGSGEVVAKVTATVDANETSTTAEVFDPDSAVLRSERTSNQTQSQDSQAAGGVAGAAANQPLAPTAVSNGPQSRGASSGADEVKNFEISKTTTHTVARAPRLVRLSVAVLVDGADGKPRPEAEMARLTDLAKRAVGFDAVRGDLIDVSSSVFSRSSDEGQAVKVEAPKQLPPKYLYGGIGAAVLVIGVLIFLLTRRRAGLAPLTLRPGARVAELEAAANGMPAPVASTQSALPTQPKAALPDPSVGIRDRARELAGKDPARAAHLIRAWITQDPESREAKNV
jgi:flagellar M-ring protein FliF